ncbi:MAG: SAVED domain-containing protein [Myxococcales bacterium]|nr:SAVED domain-containing protein [Myxococcales bacterium]
MHEIKSVRKSIPVATQNLLWARAAGRCEREGCNRPLWRHLLTQRSGNKAEKAHIWSVANDGPRGREGIGDGDVDAVENLMLLCHDCHTEVDEKKNEPDYPASRLREMKRAHEARIELVTGLGEDLRSHVLLFGARVGDVAGPLRFEAVARSMLPARFPAEPSPIELGLANSATTDRDPEFWELEMRNLERLFERRVRERTDAGAIHHVSLFARAPQPLLTALGVLLTDIVPADVFPLRREPPSFGFDDDADPLLLEVEEPPNKSGPPALVLGFSATIDSSRITDVMGPDVAIWRLSATGPHNDIVRARHHLATFRSALRPLMDRIKAAHGQGELLHVFPALPIPLAVELGRVRMPKADMELRLYDQISGKGFVPALDVRGARVAASSDAERAA